MLPWERGHLARRVRLGGLEPPRGFGRDEEKGKTLDWKTISHNVLLAGLFVAMVTMFNQVNGRLDVMQAENNRRFDRVDQRLDQVYEVLRVFEGRITRLEEKAGVGPENAE